MAEHKACGDVTALMNNSAGADAAMTQGECALMRSHSRESSTIDDSGTESGEDLRHLSPQLLADVQGALSRLEGALPGLDPNRRESLVQLVSRLQSCLKIQQPNPAPPHPPPRRFSNKRTPRPNRHTVGVSREELDDARKWLEENYSYLKSKQTTKDDIEIRDRQKSTSNLPLHFEASQSKTFRPVKFTANHTKKKSDPDILSRSKKKIVKSEFHQPKLHQISYANKELPLSASISYVDDDTKTESNESLLDYDPSLKLPTTNQNNHSKIINRTLSKPENGSDGDISSAEEDSVKPLNSSQNGFLLASQKFANFLATEGKKHNRFQGRSSKKMKLRRSNTIDIPKPAHYLSSGDDYEAGSADEVSRIRSGARGKSTNTLNRSSIAFEPKTENDRKFLAFLKLADQSEPESKLVVYNQSARGGPHWSNRFSNIKTTFETLERDSKSQTNTAVAPMPNQNKRSVLDKVKQLNAVESTPIKPIQPVTTNQFSHAPRSPFRPICKSPQSPWIKPSASGTVKQLVKEKFCHETAGPPSYQSTPKATPTHDIVMPQPIRKNMNPPISSVTQKPLNYSSNAICQQNTFQNYPQSASIENNFYNTTRNENSHSFYPPNTKFCTNTLFNPSTIPIPPGINPPPAFRSVPNEQFYNSKVLTQYRLPSEPSPNFLKTPSQVPLSLPQSPVVYNSQPLPYLTQKDAAINGLPEIPSHQRSYAQASMNHHPSSISPEHYKQSNASIKHNFPTPDYSPVNYNPSIPNSPLNPHSAGVSTPFNPKNYHPADSHSMLSTIPYQNHNEQFSRDSGFLSCRDDNFMVNQSSPFTSVISHESRSGYSTPLNSVTPNLSSAPEKIAPSIVNNASTVPYHNSNSVVTPFTNNSVTYGKTPFSQASEKKIVTPRHFDSFLSDNEEVRSKLPQNQNPHRNSVHNFSNFYQQRPFESIPIQKTYSLSNINSKQELNHNFERNYDPFYSELQSAALSSYPPSSVASNVSSPRFDNVPSLRDFPTETKNYFSPELPAENRNSFYAPSSNTFSSPQKVSGESLSYSSPMLEPTTPIRGFDQTGYDSTTSNPKLSNISPFQFDDASSSPSSWKEGDAGSPSVMQPQTAVSKVMGKAQCQQAIVVSDRTRRRFDEMAQKLSSELSQKIQSTSDRSTPSVASPSSGQHSRSSSLHSNFISPVKSPSTSKSFPYGQNSSSLNRSSSSYSINSSTTSPSSHSSSSPFHSVQKSNDVKPAPQPSPPSSPTIIKATPANKPPGPPLSPSFQQIPPISNSPFLNQFGMGTMKSKSQHLLSPVSNSFSHQNFSSTRSSPANPSYPSYSPDLIAPIAKFPSSHFSSPSRSPARSPTSSVLQKSESWHQMVVEQMLQAKQAPPLPKISRAKSSHALAFPKQYEASLTPDAASKKQATVKEYLQKTSKSASTVKMNSKSTNIKASIKTPKKDEAVVKLNDDLGNVDEAFESLFQEVNKKKTK